MPEAKELLDMLNNPNNRAYLNCVKKSPAHKNTVLDIENKLKDMMVILKKMDSDKNGSFDVRIGYVINILKHTKEIMILQKSDAFINHGITKCTKEYIKNAMYALGMSLKHISNTEESLTKLRDNITKANTKTNTKAKKPSK